MRLHYNTTRIIHKVENNQNREALLSDTGLITPDGEFQEPVPIKELTNQLEEIFNAGADIIMETNTGFADEGGDCYIAYIIKPEYKKSHYDYMDDNVENPELDYNLAIMKYIIEYPTHCYQIWAGPY